MGIKFDNFDFITGMIKIGITAILSTETAIDPSLKEFIGCSVTELLSSLSFEKKKTISDSIKKIPDQIMPVIAEFTMPNECRENLAHGLFTLDRLKVCAKSKDIGGTIKSLIIEICRECPDCDIRTLQTDEIADAILEKVVSIFFEDKTLCNIVSLFYDRATYEVALDINTKLGSLGKLIFSDDTQGHVKSAYTSQKQKISWVTTLPYIPATRHHIARENEEDMVQHILGCTKCAISGIVGGIGKTELLQLVCKQILDTRQCYYVGWIHYSGNIRVDILDSIAPQFISNNDPIKSLLTLDDQYGQDMILFIDNANSNNDDEELHILNRLTCKVIVTTRNQSFLDFDMVYLNLLSKDVASKIYLTYKGQSNSKADYYIEQIVELCGNHPMAIELVAKYAKKRKLANRTVYSELLENGYSLNGLVDSNWNGNRNELIATQFSKLYKLSGLLLNKQTKYILKCFAILPSKPLTKLFVDGIVDGKNADYCIFDTLVDSGWISSLQSTWYMHDVVKSVIKRELIIVVDDCADFLQYLCQYSTNLVDYSVLMNSQTLLIGVAEFFSDAKPSVLLTRIYNNIGYVYEEITDYQNAKTWFEKAINFSKRLEKDKELILLQALISNNMGLVLQHEIEQKKYQEEKISNHEIQSIIDWYDRAIEHYEMLLRKDSHNWLDIERRKLVAENNKATFLYQWGEKDVALSSLEKIMNKKIQIVKLVIKLILNCYSKLLNDNRYNKIPAIIEGHKSIKALASIIYKNYPLSSNTPVYQDVDFGMPSADVFKVLNDYRFAFDNELIPSLIRSCNACASVRCDYAMTLGVPDEITYQLAMATSIINFALDLCEKIEKVTAFEGDAWGILSTIHFTWEQIFPNFSSKDAAINEQLHGVQILELLFQETSNTQSKDSLVYAYINMYKYTGAEEWKMKADQLMRSW